MKLHIFNPETDYALASNSISYTPPAAVQSLKNELSLFPSIYADSGDAILLPEGISLEKISMGALARLVVNKNIKLVKYEDIDSFIKEYPHAQIKPWGWNQALVHYFERKKISHYLPFHVGIRKLYPLQDDIDLIRRLSHRRTAIQFLRNFKDIMHPSIKIPLELDNIAEVMKICSEEGEHYLKAPWSSSGRGLLYTKELLDYHIEPWARGVINHQNSVIIETAYERGLDFATEWDCESGGVKFIGLSTFKTSPRGKFKSSYVNSQENIADQILQHVDISDARNNLTKIIHRQTLLLATHIAPFYDGPVGIDMLVTKDGVINPCVEINLRLTIGRIAIEVDRRKNDSATSKFEKEFLEFYTSDSHFYPLRFTDDNQNIQ